MLLYNFFVIFQGFDYFRGSFSIIVETSLIIKLEIEFLDLAILTRILDIAFLDSIILVYDIVCNIKIEKWTKNKAMIGFLPVFMISSRQRADPILIKI